MFSYSRLKVIQLAETTTLYARVLWNITISSSYTTYHIVSILMFMDALGECVVAPPANNVLTLGVLHLVRPRDVTSWCVWPSNSALVLDLMKSVSSN